MVLEVHVRLHWDWIEILHSGKSPSFEQNWTATPYTHQVYGVISVFLFFLSGTFTLACLYVCAGLNQGLPITYPELTSALKKAWMTRGNSDLTMNR